MKAIISLVIILCTPLLQAQIEHTNITVEVDSITSNDGSVIFGLYSENSFMKSRPEYAATGKIADGIARVTFENIPNGTYAVLCIHDVNDNQQMDFEPSGMPREDYGVSNNKLNPYGPPLWSDAKIEVKGEHMHLDLQLMR